MTGGSHIRAVGPGGGAEALGDAAETHGETLTLDERWVENAPHEEVWEEVTPRRTGWIAIAFAVLAIGGWSAFFAWANRGPLAALDPVTAGQLISAWAVPVLLVAVLLLLALRLSRREAGRFTEAAVSLRNESDALESRLQVVNRELSMARDFLAAQSREIDALGRVATQRISEHADRLQTLIRDNGEQVDAIAGVSRSALDNMVRLRDDLPVVANAARDVSNQIGNAGNTAHAQLDELVAGFGRLNEFGQASERQVSSLKVKIEATLAGFEAQTAQLDDITGARFAALREKSEAFRAELDGREVDALAAMRHRADRLRAEVEASRTELDAHEEELLKSLQARISGMRESAATVGTSLANGEREALAAWNTRVEALKDDLAAAIAQVEAIDKSAKAGAEARLAQLSQEAELVDAKLTQSHALFVGEVEKRRAEASSIAAEHAQRITAQLADIDREIAERRMAHEAQSAALAQQAANVAARLVALGEEMSRAGDQGREAETALANAIDALAARLSASRAALGDTDAAVAELTEASVRLLELIRASAEHSQTQLPAAIGDAELRLSELGNQGENLGLMLRNASDHSRELSEYVLAASRDSATAMGDVRALQGQITATQEENRGLVAELRAQIAGLTNDSQAAAEVARGTLSEAIAALEAAARNAVTGLEQDSATSITALASRIGDEAAGAIDRALQAKVGAALAELEGTAGQAAGVGRQAAIQLRDQLAKVSELAANLEARVAHARQRAEEQVDTDFARRVALITESLNSHAIDIAKALSSDVTDTAWASYLRGDRGIFTRRAVRLIDNTQAREIAELFDSDGEFREHVSRYIHDFEAMLRTMLSTRDGHAIGVTLLSSDMGKLYVALAQAIERLRD